MRFIFALLFAFMATSYAFPQFHILESRKDKNGTAMAHRNGTSKANTVKKVCKKMNRLVRLTDLAANQTKLDALVAKGKLNDTEVAKLKAKAVNATATLQTMQANTTLVDECNAFNANLKVRAECFAMKRLAKYVTLANNKTAMDAFVAKKQLNATEAANLQDQVSKADAALQGLQKNTTLVDLCNKQKDTKNNGRSRSWQLKLHWPNFNRRLRYCSD